MNYDFIDPDRHEDSAENEPSCEAPEVEVRNRAFAMGDQDFGAMGDTTDDSDEPEEDGLLTKIYRVVVNHFGA